MYRILENLYIFSSTCIDIGDFYTWLTAVAETPAAEEAVTDCLIIRSNCDSTFALKSLSMRYMSLNSAKAHVVHAGHTVGVHGGLLFLRVLAAIALDLYHEVQRIVSAVSVVHEDNEVGAVHPRFGAVAIRHLEFLPWISRAGYPRFECVL
jgi:hypothetical protein